MRNRKHRTDRGAQVAEQVAEWADSFVSDFELAEHMGPNAGPLPKLSVDMLRVLVPAPDGIDRWTLQRLYELASECYWSEADLVAAFATEMEDVLFEPFQTGELLSPYGATRQSVAALAELPYMSVESL